MLPVKDSFRAVRLRRQRERGSLIITAMLIAGVLGIALTSYIALSRNSMRLAYRTFFGNDAINLAEAGLEEAFYSFNQMGAGKSTASAWANWTVVGANAKRTMTFNRDQNAIATVKIYVKGFDGSDSDPYVISQATITPFDKSPPTVRIVQVNLGKNAYFNNGMIGINGIDLRGTIVADSYNSGQTRKFTNDNQLTTNTSVAVKTGSLNVPSGNTLTIGGDLYTGTGITKPATVTLSGTQYPDYTGIFPLPVYPSGTPVTVGRKRKRKKTSFNTKWSTTLPASGDTAFSDGKYYYSVSNVTISKLTIQPNKDVVIVGTKTRISANSSNDIKVSAGATLTVYMDGPIDVTQNAVITSDWAGALQVYTSTTTDCDIATKSTFYACIYAPYADLNFTGDTGDHKGDKGDKGQGDGKSIVGSFVAKTISSKNAARLIYDEALTTLNAGRVWNISGWWEMSDSTDRSTIGTLTGGFLP